MGFVRRKNNDGTDMELSDTDQLLISIIKENKAKVHIQAYSRLHYSFEDNNHMRYTVFGGAFCGNNVNVINSNVVDVDGSQVVFPLVLRDIDYLGGKKRGSSALHELVESYIGCMLSYEAKTSSPRAGLPGSVYEKAHEKTQEIAPQPEVRVFYQDQNNDKYNEPNEDCIKEVFQIKMPAVNGEYWETYKSLPYQYH